MKPALYVKVREHIDIRMRRMCSQGRIALLPVIDGAYKAMAFDNEAAATLDLWVQYHKQRMPQA